MLESPTETLAIGLEEASSGRHPGLLVPARGHLTRVRRPVPAGTDRHACPALVLFSLVVFALHLALSSMGEDLTPFQGVEPQRFFVNVDEPKEVRAEQFFVEDA